MWGTKAAKELAQYFKTMTALQEASIEQLLEIDGLGDIIAYSVKLILNNHLFKN